MIAELHKCPSLYATCKDGIVIMARMTSDSFRLCISCATTEGHNFESEFNEATLQPIKDTWSTGASWESFFECLQQSFTMGHVVADRNGFVDCTSTGSNRSLGFYLKSSTEDVQKAVLASLLSYHHIHSHYKEVEKQVEEATRQEGELGSQAADLEKEEQVLKDGMVRNKDQDGVNQRRLQDLQASLTAIEEQKRKAGTLDASSTVNDEELAICRCRLPLGTRQCKEYDVELLKVVKSKFMINQVTDAVEPLAAFNKVVRPFTASEFTVLTSNLSNNQRHQVYEALHKIDAWDYDVFDIQRSMTGDDNSTLNVQPRGGSLFVTMYALLFRCGLMQMFHMDEGIVLNWLSCIEAGYHPNPYHNSMHAADVLQITHFILSVGGLTKRCNLTDEDVFAALFAAAIHDYDHPGINNSFHIKAQTYLATLYNDRSVLENRHVSSVFELMKLPAFNILSAFTEDQKRDIRETIIEMVLATDMGQHGRFVNQFKRRLQENHDFTKKEDVRLALSMAVKMADISNCGRPERLYLKWSNKIADEFYMQGDRERNLGMPCSPFMDRLQPAMAKGQIAFMNYIVVPLFDCISEYLPDMRFSVEMTESNKAYWARNDDSARY